MQEDLSARIGCRPPFLRLLFTDPRLLWRLWFGPCHPASYRLVGPGSWPGAHDAIFNALRHTDVATKTRLANTNQRPSCAASEAGEGGGWFWWVVVLSGCVLAVVVIVFHICGLRRRETEPEGKESFWSFLGLDAFCVS